MKKKRISVWFKLLVSISKFRTIFHFRKSKKIRTVITFLIDFDLFSYQARELISLKAKSQQASLVH